MSPAAVPGRALRPASIAALSEAVRDGGPFFVVGNGAHLAFRALPTFPPTRLLLDALSGVVSLEAADQVVVVRAGTRVADLQAALAERNQCLPLGECLGVDPADVTVGGAIAMNLPHTREALAGSWREWVLGMTLVLADGTVAKCGSRAVKNVTGYDVHRLLVGSRGTLGVMAEVILRTLPLGALPPDAAEMGPSCAGMPMVVHRVMSEDFAIAREMVGSGLLMADPATATLWYAGETPIAAFNGDWHLVATGDGRPVRLMEPTANLMARAKAVFDPADKLNPGEFALGDAARSATPSA